MDRETSEWAIEGSMAFADGAILGAVSEAGPSCRVDAIEGNDDRFRVLGEVEVGLDPEGVVVDATTNRAYVACSRSNWIAVVDLETLERISTIPVGAEPIDIALDARTRRVFTANARADEVSVVDIETEKVIAQISVGMYPAGLAIDEGYRRLYSGDSMGSTVSVIDLDTLEKVATIEAELGAGAIAVSSEERRLYCANFVTASVTVIDQETNEAIGRYSVGEAPCAVAVHPTRRELFVVNCLASTIAHIDTEKGETIAELPVPNAPVGLAAAASGDRLYVANRGDGSMSIVGIDGEEWARIPVGAAPGGVCAHPGKPEMLLIANAGSSSLTVAIEHVDGPPASRLGAVEHVLVGKKIPDFALADLTSGQIRHIGEWAEKKYIINFFASW